MTSSSPIEVALSGDGLTLELQAPSGAIPRLSACQVDELMRSLAHARTQMRPVHPADPPNDREQTFHGDNLLWTVRPSPHQPAIEIGIQHPGLGWVSLTLSRAQVEDLTASLAFSANEIRRIEMKSSE
jgi:hypothetical protein